MSVSTWSTVGCASGIGGATSVGGATGIGGTTGRMKYCFGAGTEREREPVPSSSTSVVRPKGEGLWGFLFLTNASRPVPGNLSIPVSPGAKGDSLVTGLSL